MTTTRERTGARPDADAVPADPRRRHHRTRGPRRGLSLQSLVVVEIMLAIGLVIWWRTDVRMGWIAVAVAAAMAPLLVSIGGRRSLAGRAFRRLGFRWARARRRTADLAPVPFDIPVGSANDRAAAQRTGTGNRLIPAARGHRSLGAADVIGARWVDDTLVTVVRVAPGSTHLTRLTPGDSTVTDPTDQLVPLAALAECINPFDIPLSSIDVISHGVRSWGTGPVPQTYHRTLGPLPATAHRSVLVILRLNPLDCPDAVARRGGGAVGALRTATITTRRVAQRLAENGLSVSVLSATEITAVTAQLVEGADLDNGAEQWDSVTCGPVRMRSAAITSDVLEPNALSSLLGAIWVNSVLSATVALRLRHDDGGGLIVSGIVRVNELPSGGRTLDSWPDGLSPLDGRQFDAMVAGVPVLFPHRLDRELPAVYGADAEHLLEQLSLPAGGCGQLIGADHYGRAVAVPLVGPDVRSVAIAAGMHLVAQVILRAIAIGASVTVRTVRPRQWQHLIATVGDQNLLALATDRATQQRGHRVVVFDGMTGPAPDANTTHIVVLAPGDPRIGQLVPDATVILRQNPRSPQDISVFTGNEREQVTMVATPDEWTFIGGYTDHPDGRAPAPGRTPVGR